MHVYHNRRTEKLVKRKIIFHQLKLWYFSDAETEKKEAWMQTKWSVTYNIQTVVCSQSKSLRLGVVKEYLPPIHSIWQTSKLKVSKSATRRVRTAKHHICKIYKAEKGWSVTLSLVREDEDMKHLQI